MQHVGPQCGQGAVPSSHHPSNYSPLETPANCGSTTSSLRQWRKKDALDKQQTQQQQQQQQQAAPEVSASENPSHIARVAPHTHYPSRSNEIFRYPATYQEYNLGYKEPSLTPVKYSEIVETSPIHNLEHIPPQVVQKNKEKDFMEMCSVQEPHLNHMKQSYPEPMKGSYGETLPPPPQYIPKEPQLHPYVQKESQIHQQQFQQYLQKYNMQHSQYPRNYSSEPNNFLATLNKINPRIAQSIINDPHIRDAQVGMYQEQTRAAFQQSQRMIHGPSIHGSPNYPNHPPRNMQPYNYPPHTYGYKHMETYNRMAQFQQIPKYHHQDYKINSHVEQPPRNISPRRTFTESIPMPVNYAPMPSKVSPNYSQCSQLEYAQHYQHRRSQMQHDYYQAQNYKNPYMANHQMTQETSEMRQTASNRIKQFLENWVDEDVSGSLPDIIISNNPNDMEKLQVVKGPVRIKDDGTQLFVLGSTEIPHENIAHYLHLQQIEKLGYYEDGVLPESARYVIKNPSEAAVLIEDDQNPSCVVDKVVNLHIVEQDPGKVIVQPTDHVVANCEAVTLVENVLNQEATTTLEEPPTDKHPNITSPKNMPIIDETLENIVGETPQNDGGGDKSTETCAVSSTNLDEVIPKMVEPDDKPEIGEEISNMKASERLKSLARNYGGGESPVNPKGGGCVGGPPVNIEGVDKIANDSSNGVEEIVTDSNRVDGIVTEGDSVGSTLTEGNRVDDIATEDSSRVDKIVLTSNRVDQIAPFDNSVVDNKTGLSDNSVDKMESVTNSVFGEIAPLDDSVGKIEPSNNNGGGVDKIAISHDGDGDKPINAIGEIDKIVTFTPDDEVSTKEPQKTKTEEENQSIPLEGVEKVQLADSNCRKIDDDDSTVEELNNNTTIVETKEAHDNKNGGGDKITTITNCVVEDVENLIAKNIIVNTTKKQKNDDDPTQNAGGDIDKDETPKTCSTDTIENVDNAEETKETLNAIEETVTKRQLREEETKTKERSPTEETPMGCPPPTQLQTKTNEEADVIVELTENLKMADEDDHHQNLLEVEGCKTAAHVEETIEDDHDETGEVQYRSALKIDDNNVLLHIADELLEIKITVSESGQKIVTVIPLTGATVVDVEEKDINENTIKSTDEGKTNECFVDGEFSRSPDISGGVPTQLDYYPDGDNQSTLGDSLDLDETKDSGDGGDPVKDGASVETNESASVNKCNRTTTNSEGDVQSTPTLKTIEEDPPIMDEPTILYNEIIIGDQENNPNEVHLVAATNSDGSTNENKCPNKKKPPKTKASKKHYDFKIEENKTKANNDREQYVAPIIMKRARIILEKVKVPDTATDYYVKETKEPQNGDVGKTENACKIPKMRIPKKKVSFDETITEIDDKICKKSTEVRVANKTKETKMAKSGKPPKAVNGVGKNEHSLVEGCGFKPRKNTIESKTKSVSIVGVGEEPNTKVDVGVKTPNGINSEVKIDGNPTKMEVSKPPATISEGSKPPASNPTELLKPSANSDTKLNIRDPRIKAIRERHRHHEDSSQKRRLSLQEYNSRKRHASTSDTEKPSASTVPYYETTTETLMEAFLSPPPPPLVPNPETFDIDLMRPEPPVLLPVRPKHKIIDIDEFDIPSKNDEFNSGGPPEEPPKSAFLSSDDEIKQCKEEVGLKLNSIELHLPKPYKGPRFFTKPPELTGKTQTETAHEKTIRENDLLMRRFLNRETLTVEEVEKVKEIIKCKRVLEEINKAKVLKQKNKDSECRVPIEYPTKCDLSTFKIHLKKIRDGFTRRRKRFRNLYSQSSSDDGDDETTTNSVDYSVYQSKCEDGVPKLIIKRKFSDIQNVMQPVVRLERLPTLDLMAKRKKT